MKALIIITVCIIVIALCVGCTSTPYQVRDLDHSFDIEAKGSVGRDKTVGLNGDKQVIVQTRSTPEDELLVQETVNMHLQEQLESELFSLKRCRQDLADPRLGGNGSVASVPEVDSLKSPVQVREEIGLDDNGEIKVVKNEYFVERLKAERKYQKTLEKLMSVVKKHSEECEVKMGQARRSHGLPSSRYQPEGYFTNGGTWVPQRQGEMNLDDAFRIQAEQAASH